MNRRGPTRSARAPKRRERANITNVTGTIVRPLSSVLYPATCCKKIVRKKKRIARPAYIAKVSAFPTAKLRREKSVSSSIGSATRRS
jgi:hypothetical protein